MIRNNKVKFIISSVIILLPILFGVFFWNKLPSVMPTHWGADGQADGFASRAFAVFFMPLLLLAIHVLCLVLTSFDRSNRGQNKKALGLVFWLCPAISIFANTLTYSASLGHNFDPIAILPVFLGLMFIFIGNYMPKCKQNNTLGIKIRATLESEANWNATHRFAGRIWFFGGFLMLLSAFLPEKLMLIASFSGIFVLTFIPIVYSLIFRKKERESGTLLAAKPHSKLRKVTAVICIAVSAAAVIFALVLVFTGNITVKNNDGGFTVKADYYTDLDVKYDDIESIELKENVSFGKRVFGFGSPRLLMGNFENEQFGSYTLYAYAKAKTAVVITSKSGKILVIALKSTEKTEELYASLLGGINQ